MSEIYKNVPFTEVIASTKLSDILRGKTKTSYDDVVYADQSYPRFRTVVLDSIKFNAPEEYTINKINTLLSILDSTIGIEKTTESFKIPKKNGKWRNITTPTGEYKTYLNMMTAALNECFPCTPDNAYAYVKGRCIMNAVNRHKDNNWFLKMDLTNFFGSITKETLTEQLNKTYPFNFMQNKYVKQLVDFVTLDDVLPQGTSTSPILTNIFMTEFDSKMQDWINQVNKDYKEDVVYTRYADDILISAKKKETIDIIQTSKYVEALLDKYKLKINPDKTRVGSIAGRNWNLGLMLNKDHKLTIGHVKSRQYKAMMFQTIKRFQLTDPLLKFDFPEINGKLMWFKQVEPDYFDYLVQHFEKITGTNYYTIQSSL